jgi:hypothetical protein
MHGFREARSAAIKLNLFWRSFMSNLHEPIRPDSKLLDWLRYFCAFMLYMYGVSKLMHLQFNMSSELAQRPITSLNGYQLTWYYYGYSRVYASILGVLQITGATLLLFRKTTLLAAILILPMMANILLINMFILVNDYGPYVISALICTSMLVIVRHQRASLFSLFWGMQKTEPKESSRTHWWIRIMIVAAVSTIMISGALMQHSLRR